MKKSLAAYMEPRPSKKNAQAMIASDLHAETTKNMKATGYNWVKLIEAACRQFNEEFKAQCVGKKRAG